MANGKTDELPKPVKGFESGVDGPNLHVYPDRGKADEAAKRIPEKTRVRKRKINGRQRHVVEKKQPSNGSDGSNVEIWVEAEYDPEEV